MRKINIKRGIVKRKIENEKEKKRVRIDQNMIQTGKKRTEDMIKIRNMIQKQEFTRKNKTRLKVRNLVILEIKI